MKLATFRSRDGAASQFGALLADGRLLTLRAGALTLLAEYSLPDRYEASRLLRHARAFLENGQEAFALAYQTVQRAEHALQDGREPRGEGGQRLLYSVNSVEFLPSVPQPGKIVA